MSKDHETGHREWCDCPRCMEMAEDWTEEDE